MKFVFRTDASLQIGTGHVMRCLTLADSLRNNGGQSLFVCREHSGNLIESIRARGHEAYGLPLDRNFSSNSYPMDDPSPVHASWLETDWVNDAEQTLEVLGNSVFDWLLVDHYALESRWEHMLRGSAHRLMVIDDLADRHHDCDLLLDQNLGRRRQDYGQLVGGLSCKILVGPEYALLRPEFAALRNSSLRRRGAPQLGQILISIGGVDKNNATGQVLESLRTCSLPESCKIVVVMGASAPWLEDVKAIAAQMRWETEVRVNVREMAKLMAESDVAIGAAGTTAWERCCLGLPTLIIVVAENQWQGARSLERMNGAALLGGEEDIQSKLPAVFNKFISERNLIQVSSSARLITDGSGALKVTKMLENGK